MTPRRCTTPTKVEQEYGVASLTHLVSNPGSLCDRQAQEAQQIRVKGSAKCRWCPVAPQREWDKDMWRMPMQCLGKPLSELCVHVMVPPAPKNCCELAVRVWLLGAERVKRPRVTDRNGSTTPRTHQTKQNPSIKALRQPNTANQLQGGIPEESRNDLIDGIAHRCVLLKRAVRNRQRERELSRRTQVLQDVTSTVHKRVLRRKTCIR